jgi:Niemann-Pick C1 protein
LIGVTVLAFTRSKIFEIYYFRIWLALVIVAAAHALVFLPVALSMCGGEGWMPLHGEGLESDLLYRRLPPDFDELQGDDEDDYSEDDEEESLRRVGR